MQLRIKSPVDIKAWHDSKAFYDYTNFLISASAAIKSMKISDVKVIGEVNQHIVDFLCMLDKWIEEIPPTEGLRLRYGNPAFKIWHSRLTETCKDFLSSKLQQDVHCVEELSVYLNGSFGSEIRLDYGTGHEMNFAIFLMILFKLNLIDSSCVPATILIVFERYLNLVRTLQLTYRLEPAGSHGVWSLDDYQFLPFLWGSAQFLGNEPFEPSCFVDPKYYEKETDEYMFLSAINFINKFKTGPFCEHSNQLWNISSSPTWAKIHRGFIKMYKEEVLSKFPVIQHLQFGNLFSFDPLDM
ncbi:hypothetical protein GJ496_004690 [Pomphorhynchus laevis]|nr:hypothetical protein GJ496_004690 [Pomphorhynchus laevis]